MNTPLQQAAQELLDRWDSTYWKDQRATSEYVNALRVALEAEQAQAVEPVAWLNISSVKLPGEKHLACEFSYEQDKDAAAAVPLYTHPAPPASGERAELIARLRSTAFQDDEVRAHLREAADMLEADAILADDLTIAYMAGVEAGRKQAQQVAVPAWKTEQIDEFEIRVTSPDGEAWRLRSADRNDIFNNFIWRWAQSMLTAQGAKP